MNFFRKQIKLRYKCKPHSFKTSVTCKGDPIKLSCTSPAQRLVIILARFVSATHGHIHCPLYPAIHTKDPGKDYFQDGAVIGDIDKCEASTVTEPVMKHCHGQQSCNITGDPETLGSDNCSDLWVVLKIVWACVESRVIGTEFVDKSRSHLFKTSGQRHM